MELDIIYPTNYLQEGDTTGIDRNRIFRILQNLL
jgi:hypothetical protein